jgi:hypothetical protein
MKQTAVEWLVAHLIEYGFDLSAHKLEIEQAKEKENEQKGYSEEEVLNFTQTMIMQYKFGNTNIEQMDLLKETLQLFKNK